MSDYLYTKPLPDGRSLFVMPLLFGRARLSIGDDSFLEDSW